MQNPESDPQLPGTGTASDAPRYTGLADYLRVLRRRRLLIALVTAGLAAAALLYSLNESTVYETTAQLSFRDPLSDLNLLGSTNVAPQQAPQQLAAANAELITRPEVTRRVERELKTNHLAGSVATQVGLQTNLVLVTAKASSAGYAARLANAYARAVTVVGTATERKRVADAVHAVAVQLARAKRNPNPAITSVRVSALVRELARLQALKTIAQPVQIVEHASVPGAPVSPKPIRNTILGALAGLVLGLLAAFARESLDRRVRSAHDVQEELGAPVLTRVPDTALGSAGLARNGRPPMADLDFEAFRVLRMNLGYLSTERPLRSILITSGLPEEGKSTVSMSLASASVLAGQRTLLVECDLRRPSFARRLGIARSPGLTDFLLGDAGLREVLQTVEIAKPGTLGNRDGGTSGDPGGVFVCITAGTQVKDPAELLISERFGGFLEQVTKVYDRVVLDASPLLTVVDPLEIMPRVDAVIICVRAQKTTRDQARAARAALSNLPRRPIGAVLTGLRRSDRDAYDYYYGY
jgi:polysaccharide biosynthesis transport protein